MTDHANTDLRTPAIGANQCEHGSLARSCVVCELTAERDDWRHVAAYYLGDFSDSHGPVECRAEAMRRAIESGREHVDAARAAERERIAGLLEAEAEEEGLHASNALLRFAAKLRAEGETLREAVEPWKRLPAEERDAAVNALRFAGLREETFLAAAAVLRAEGT
jgi:hypothetical protein